MFFYTNDTLTSMIHIISWTGSSAACNSKSISSGSWHPHPWVIGVITFLITWLRECGSITIAGWLFTRIVRGSVIKVIVWSYIKLAIEIISTLFSYYTIVSLWEILVATIILSIMCFVTQGASFFKLVTRSIAIVS